MKILEKSKKNSGLPRFARNDGATCHAVPDTASPREIPHQVRYDRENVRYDKKDVRQDKGSVDIESKISNSEKFADLIASSKKELVRLKNISVNIFRKSFSNSIPQELLNGALESLENNYQRHFKFRGDEILHTTYSVNADDKLDADMNPIYNFSFLSDEETKKTLIGNGFLAHPVNVIPDWSKHINLRNNIFERFIVNDNKKPMNYYLHGGMGVGKTTLLTGIARMLLKMLKINPLYITMPSLTKLITSIATTDKSELERLKTANFLFVDDIGQEKYTTDNQESLMRDFFVHRYGNLLPTFFAGNIDIKNKEKQGIFYKQLNDYMKDSKLFKVINIKGESRRK